MSRPIGNAHVDALLVAIDPRGVEFAIPTGRPGEVEQRERVDSAARPTFTDAIMHYADRHGIHLKGCRLFMSVAGALNGGTIRVTNGNWFISISGLEALTGIRPHVVNDVTAMAYETLGAPRLTPVGIVPEGAWDRHRRRALVYAGAGLGAACIDRTGDGPRILDSEAGHAAFAPVDEREWQLTRKLAVPGGAPSCEQVVAHLDGGGAGDADRDRWLASVLGRYCVAVTTTYAAWGGVYLCGPLFDRIVRQGGSATLRAAFGERGKMRGLLAGVPTWLLSNRSDAIAGLCDVHASMHPEGR